LQSDECGDDGSLGEGDSVIGIENGVAGVACSRLGLAVRLLLVVAAAVHTLTTELAVRAGQIIARSVLNEFVDGPGMRPPRVRAAWPP
jgi:hypothetical protein